MLCSATAPFMMACDNNKRPLLSVYKACTSSSSSSSRRGKVFPYSSFSVPATIDEHQNEVQPPHTTSSSSSSNNNNNNNNIRRSDEVMPTAEDFANLFFASSEDDDDSSSSTTSSSIQSLTMNHHQWEPEPHWQQNTTITTSGGTTATAAAATFTTPHHNNHKRRRVSFTTDTPTVHSLTSVPPASTMTPHEKAATWLQSTEIELLKSSAQSTIQNMRQRVLQQKNPRQFISQQQDRQQQHRHTQFRKLMLSLEHETNSSIRGLEHKIYRRKHNRQLLIADVIECQHHINGLAKFGFKMDVDEKRRLLANASLKKSVGCVKRALADAIDDYKEVYPASTASADCSSSLSPFPSEPLSSSISKIRRVSSGACSSR